MENSKVWDALDSARQQMGDTYFLDALTRAMGTDSLDEYLKYISRMYELDLQLN